MPSPTNATLRYKTTVKAWWEAKNHKGDCMVTMACKGTRLTPIGLKIESFRVSASHPKLHDVR